MKIKSIYVALLISLSLITIIFSPLQANDSDLLKRQEELLKEIQKNESLLNQKKQEEKQTLSLLKTLTNNIISTDKEIKKIETNLTQTQKDINFLNSELNKSEKAAEQRKAYLTERLRDMYIEGEVKYLEVLLDSTSITDFLTRWDLLNKIANNDAQIIETLHQEIESITVKKEIISSKQVQLQVYSRTERKKEASSR